ncbi:eCIS core domain-containing protein [Flavobacterium hauense]
MKTQVQQPKAAETVQPKAEKQASVETILAGYNSPLQRKTAEEEPLQKKENNTGLPDNLKSGVENLSGYSMDDVNVHYNSSQPAEMQAHAYAQGSDIHIAPGQEQHLPHEAWHVVQQKQGRVKPTMQMKGKVNVNDDAGLETEADVMGAKSLQKTHKNESEMPSSIGTSSVNTYQLVAIKGKLLKEVKGWAKGKTEEVINWFLEDTDETAVRAALEMDFAVWWKNVYMNDGSVPKVIEADPYKEVNKKIKTSPYKASFDKFTDTDKDEIIATHEATTNWPNSIKTVYDTIITPRAEREVRDARVAKFVNAKTAGDAIFTAGLVKDIWDCTWSVVNSTSPKNVTLPIAHTDGNIGVAVTAWRAVNKTIDSLVGAADDLSITDIHVPGGANFIEDKSTRAVNPDPNRGRQADFKSTWDNLDVNVHVDSTVRH